jgi:hypothetical protein
MGAQCINRAHAPVLQRVFICTYPQLYNICTYCGLLLPRHMHTHTHTHTHVHAQNHDFNSDSMYFWIFLNTILLYIMSMYILHILPYTCTCGGHLQSISRVISQRLAMKDERQWRTFKHICQYTVIPCHTVSKEGAYISEHVQHWPVKPGGHSQV